MPTPTQINTDDIRELAASSQHMAEQVGRLADEIRESNRQFGSFRVEVAQDFGRINASLEELRGELKGGLGELRGELKGGLEELRGELKDGLGELRGELREFKGRMETWLSVAKWAVGAIVLGFTLVGGLAFNTSREVAKLDARMTSFETTSRTLQSSMEKLTDALRVKAENVQPTPNPAP